MINASALKALGLLALTGCATRYSQLPPISAAELQAPLPVYHRWIDGIDVAYIDSAAGPEDRDKPVVVFVHGLSSYMGFWEYQIPAFAEHYRVVALDLPGFGASGRPDAPYTPPWYATFVSHWLDELGVPSATVVGHSMGGQIAMTLALQDPERVSGLVLSAPAGIERFSRGSGEWMKTFWTEGRALQAREEELRATFTTMVFNNPDAGVERLLEERVRMSGTPEFRGTSVAVSRCIAGMIDYPVMDRVPEIKAPTLIVFGTDDRMIPNPVFTGGSTRAIANAGQAAIPGSTLVMIPGAGHTVHHDAPTEFNAALEHFLSERGTR